MIKTEEVEKIASLSRLTLTQDEKAKFAEQLSAVLESFQTLQKVDTKGIEPLVTPSEIEVTYREDQAEKWMGAEAAVANAPEKSGHLFKVPPVV